MSDSPTFKDAYQTLQKHAETLRTQSEPDIDNLMTIVSESVVAFKVCKERIDAVEKALEDALADVPADTDPVAQSRLVGSGSPGAEDDDPPF